jgi:hypothetical protein
MERSATIELVCQRRGIDRLLHFTRWENVPGILENGIRAREWLRSKSRVGYRAWMTDEGRYDGRTDHVSLSIGFPNFQMFFKYRKETPDAKWAVLDIHPSLLFERACAYYSENAAKARWRRVDPQMLMSDRALNELFLDFVSDNRTVVRQDLGIPDGWPTHPQAEVLVHDHVPASYIRAIHVEQLGLLKDGVAAAGAGGPPVTELESTELFKPRSDHRFWKAQPKLVDSDNVMTILDDLPF